MSNTRKHKDQAKFKRTHSWRKRSENIQRLMDEYDIPWLEATQLYDSDEPDIHWYTVDKRFARPRAVRETARQQNRAQRRAAHVKAQQGDDESLPKTYKRDAWWLAY